MQCVLVGGLHEEGADDRREDAEACNSDGQHDHAFDALLSGVGECAQGHGGDDRTHIGLKEVCAHAGHIAHIVAHVVSDRAGVAGVILGDARFHFADEVCTHIGGFGEDTATHAREERDGRGAEAEAEHMLQAFRRNPKPHREAGHAGQGQTNHAHAHDHARAERDA